MRTSRSSDERSSSTMKTRTGSSNMEIFVFLGIFVAWFALQWWILPHFGVAT